MLRNRIVSTPHATGWSHDGLIAQTEIDYQVRTAGGVGLVMTFGSLQSIRTNATSPRCGHWPTGYARVGKTIEIDRQVPIPAPIGGQESDLVGA